MAKLAKPRDSQIKDKPASKGRILRSHHSAKLPTQADKALRLTEPSATPAVPFRFLELAAELRAAIYEYSALHSTAILRPNHGGRLLSNSPLARVSHQVRDEYAAAVYLAAPVITADIFNLNFTHLVTFINKLSDRELRVLPSLDVPSSREILVKVHLTGKTVPQLEMLNRWLLRCGHPTKKGTNIKVTYMVFGQSVFNNTYYPYGEICRSSWNAAWSLAVYGGMGPPPHIGTPVGDVYAAQKAVLLRI
ncbi:hypothetical protein LTR56_007601 [Elasticomyces elasticus]|nr:hypothetical protein LTR56_007601 [Elasticomyces elasticus]KAK3665302.1 hypothetical protein LTR22_003824 [Elasticomyces elasticus]KAK4929725.1 hypothetical protein LTR49_003683 [Elasticomyces elasticus]KAK5761055.1 hypothetical protein LTS12_008732 [Elasticomyces elasticus]